MTSLTPPALAPALAKDRTVRFVVAALTRRGAYLQVERDHADLYSDRNSYAAPLSVLAMDAFRALAAADWIELNSHGQWLLSKTGRDAVRRARSGETEPGDTGIEGAANDRLPASNENENFTAATPAPGRAVHNTPIRSVTERDSPLAWLHSRRDKEGRQLLSDHAYDAGERLRADFWFAAMTPRITANWSPVAASKQRSAPGAGSDMPDNVIAAQQRVRRALAAVGPELSGILIEVCCHEKGIEDTEREVGWPVRSGRIVLQLALERLARHYGLTPPERNTTWAPEGRIRNWGSANYRPGFDGPTAP
jgi:Domain of unknown function (DUF6456)